METEKPAQGSENDAEEGSTLDLSGANLMFTNLRYVNLGEVNFSEARLNEANLSHTNLSEADLSRANLTKANLRCVDLSEAIFVWNFRRLGTGGRETGSPDDAKTGPPWP